MPLKGLAILRRGRGAKQLATYASFTRARKALFLTLASIAVLLIPLGVSFGQLVRQSQLEASLREALLNRTITFQRIELMTSRINWLTDPPEVRLNVRAREPITPNNRVVEASQIAYPQLKCLTG
ncbi:MAG: hypothetical protein ACP5RH_13650 [Leptodesmis sp.]|uniref:hypothetical protein n=1 Tax=Leptodesmis sp. TaxID=3100501 RepID=UPI003D0C6824